MGDKKKGFFRPAQHAASRRKKDKITRRPAAFRDAAHTEDRLNADCPADAGSPLYHISRTDSGRAAGRVRLRGKAIGQGEDTGSYGAMPVAAERAEASSAEDTDALANPSKPAPDTGILPADDEASSMADNSDRPDGGGETEPAYPEPDAALSADEMEASSDAGDFAPGTGPDPVEDEAVAGAYANQEGLEYGLADDMPTVQKGGRKSRLRALLIGGACLVALALVGGGLALSGLFRTPEADPSAAEVSRPADSGQALAGSTSSGTTLAVTRSDRIVGTYITAGREFLTQGQDGVQAAASLETAMDAAGTYGCNTILFPVNDKTQAAAPSGGSYLDLAIDTAHAKGMALYAVYDLSEGQQLDLSRSEDAAAAVEGAAAIAGIQGLDGLLLEGCAYGADAGTYADYLAEGGGMGYDAFRRDRLTAAVRQASLAVREANGSLYLGVAADPVWATAATVQGGIELETAAAESYAAGADTLGWLQAGYFDWAMVSATATGDGAAPFETVAAWWNQKAQGHFGLCFRHAADKALAAAEGYESPDQLVKQVAALKGFASAGSAFYTLADLTEDTSGGAAVLQKYLTGQLPEGYQPADLRISSPASRNLTTTESSIGFVGASDTQFPLLLNGQEVTRTDAGYFSLQMDLQTGANTFTFQHKGQTLTYTVTYRQVLLKEIAPAGGLTLDGGAVIMVKAVARKGSTVTASLGDTSITLDPQISDNPEDTGGDFITYLGTFSMPSNLSSDTRMGQISFTAHYGGQSESMTGGVITVRAGNPNDPGLPPFQETGDGSENYINVGTGLIAEAVSYQIETFDGNIIDDRSRPTNNYLPAGTVDYCSRSTVMDAGSGFTYRVLRYGKRVYTSTEEKGDNIKVYEGTLPETNNVTAAGVREDDRFLYMTFDVDWKAPFRFKLAPQGYQNPYPSGGAPNYSISSPTFDHVDITFCYAGTAQGKIDLPADNPIFSGAEWIKNEADYTLRLYLKKTGGLYGWNAEYNGDGQLVFSFLKPVQLKAADNPYGVSLEGVKIVLDPGHGGSDPGAVGSDPRYTEAILNSTLTYKVRDRLTALGAEVTLTKNDSDRVGLDPRVRTVKSVKPDLFISFHRNSSTSTSSKGYESYYFNPFSEPLSRAVYNRNAGLYLDQRGNKWGNFYVMRVSDCPAILTENGFVSNADEYSLLVTDAFNEASADATVQGIVDYLKSIQQ